MTDARWRPGEPVDWERPGELWTAGGLHSFVLETIGARTGQVRRAVLGYLDEGNDGWLVIASKGGAPTNPAWVANLAAQPDATVVLADGTRVPVHAERLAGEELERGLGAASARRRRSTRCIGRGPRARSRSFASPDVRNTRAHDQPHR